MNTNDIEKLRILKSDETEKIQMSFKEVKEVSDNINLIKDISSQKDLFNSLKSNLPEILQVENNAQIATNKANEAIIQAKRAKDNADISNNQKTITEQKASEVAADLLEVQNLKSQTQTLRDDTETFSQNASNKAQESNNNATSSRQEAEKSKASALLSEKNKIDSEKARDISVEKSNESLNSANSAKQYAAKAEEASESASAASKKVEEIKHLKAATLDYAFNAFGYTKRVLAEDRFKEVNTTNTLVDCKGGFVRFSDGLYKVDKDTSINFPHAPFAGDEDELLDNSVHGLTCQKSHSKGDFVVTGVELIKNNPFTTAKQYGNDSVGVQNGDEYTLTSTSGYARNYIEIPTVPGEVYNITYSLKAGTSARAWFYIGNSGNGGALYSFDTPSKTYITKTVKIVAQNTKTYITVRTSESNASTTAMYKNISVSLENTVYQATRDTKDMFDGTTEGSKINYKGRPIVVLGKGNKGSIDGHYYKRNDGYKGTINLQTASFNTGAWLDLGTADKMSLKNPYFKKQEVVKRQDVLTLRKNKLSSKVDYYIFKGTHFFSADFSQKDVMQHYGFTNVEKNLWEDNDYEYVFISLVDRLNAGAYHPVYNPFGADGWVDKAGSIADFFYRFKVSNIKEAFIRWNSSSVADDGQGKDGRYGGLSSGISRRFDDKFYDKIYTYGIGGLIPSGGNLPYAGTELPRLLEQETKNVHTESCLEEGVVTYCDFSTTNPQDGTNYFANSSYINVYADTKEEQTQKYPLGAFVVIKDNSVNTLGGGYVTEHVNNSDSSVLRARIPNFIGNLSHADRKNNYNGFVISIVKKPYLLTYKDNLIIDILGDISQYPQTWRDCLASGKALIGNALLLDENGNSLIPNGTSKSPKGSKKYKNAYGRVYTSNKGQSYVRQVNAFDFGNKQTNIIANNAAIPTTELNLIFYTSFNSSLSVNTPKEVLSSLDKVFITNNFNNLIVPIATNKIASALEFKSKYLENTEVGIAEHNNINLANNSSAAIKYFCTLCKCEDGELGLQVFTQEIVPKNSVYNGDDNKFTSLTNTNILDLNNKKVKTKVLTKRLGIWN